MAAAPDGRIITGSWDRTVKVWRDGVCERTIEGTDIECVAVLPGGALRQRSDDGAAKLWTLDGALERTFEVSTQEDTCGASRRCPTACTLWSA